MELRPRTTESRPIEIAIAVVERDGCFLVGQRPSDVPLAGYWEFPGGKVRPGEEPAAAAVRECLEETGVPVTVVGEYPDALHDYPHGRLHLRFFACRPTDSQFVFRSPFAWIARDKLASLSFPAANGGVLKIIVGEPEPVPANLQ